MTSAALLLFLSLCDPQCLARAARLPPTRAECRALCAPAIAACRTAEPHDRRDCRGLMVFGCRHLSPEWCLVWTPPRPS